MADAALRLSEFVACSYANGPGARAVIWLQGCTLGCPGCYNPQTHPVDAGNIVNVDELAARVLSLGDQIQGITISGGEPLQQSAPLCSLLETLRGQSNLSIVIFSGFSWEEIQLIPLSDRILASIDVLIAGRFDRTQRLATRLIGSANKEMYFLSQRYRKEDFESVPVAEVVISSDGTAIITGIDPLILEKRDDAVR